MEKSTSQQEYKSTFVQVQKSTIDKDDIWIYANILNKTAR